MSQRNTENFGEDITIYFSSHLNQRAKASSLFLHPHYYCTFKAEDGNQYRSCTDYFRTQQFKILGNEEAASKIHSLRFGNEVQSLAQKLEEPLMRSDKWKLWEDKAEGVMRAAINMKFEQNPRLLQKLIMTGDKVLIEDNTKDAFWYFK